MCFLVYFSYLCRCVNPLDILVMLIKDSKKHYYYVTDVGGVSIIKAFNKKSMRKSCGVLDRNIMARYRHYTDAWEYASKRCVQLGVPFRPRYVSLTGNDVID